MYCMNIVIIGCDPKVLADVRREALNNLATIEGEFVDLSSAVSGLAENADTPPAVRGSSRVPRSAIAIEAAQQHVRRSSDYRTCRHG